MNRALIIVGLVAVLGAGCASYPETRGTPIVCAIDEHDDVIGCGLGYPPEEMAEQFAEEGARLEVRGVISAHQGGNPYMNPMTGAGLAAQGQGVEALQMMQDPGYIPMPSGPTPAETQMQQIDDYRRHRELIRAIERRDQHWRY